VQIRRPGPDQNVPDIININQLASKIEDHPDLQPIPRHKRVASVVTLYALTGCDFVSFFHGISKVQFYKLFCKFASFNGGVDGRTVADWRVSGDGEEIGVRAEQGGGGPDQGGDLQELLNRVPESLRPALAAFLRLVGTAFFTRFKARLEEATAPRSYTAVVGVDRTSLKGAIQWTDQIREQTWAALPSEEGSLPSFGALLFHFLRGVFALRIWDQACEYEISVPDMLQYGYDKDEMGQWQLMYDFPETMERVHEQINLVLKGCGCKKTMCLNRACKCRKAGQKCSPACRCLGCKNLILQGGEEANLRGSPGTDRNGAGARGSVEVQIQGEEDTWMGDIRVDEELPQEARVDPDEDDDEWDVEEGFEEGEEVEEEALGYAEGISFADEIEANDLDALAEDGAVEDEILQQLDNMLAESDVGATLADEKRWVVIECARRLKQCAVLQRPPRGV
jgi:hypothetical protein